MAAIFGATTVKASARFKDTATGKMCTANLITIPTDITESAFMEAAKDGIDLSVKSIGKDVDRSRNISGKGVYGAAATSAAAKILGFAKPPETDVPETVKNRGRSAVPSTNGSTPKAS